MDKGLDLEEASEQILQYILLPTETFVFHTQKMKKKAKSVPLQARGAQRVPGS